MMKSEVRSQKSEVRSQNEELRMKKAEEAVIRKELQRLAERLRDENEALLKLVRQINANGEANTLTSEKNKPKK